MPFILTLVDTNSYSGIKKVLVESFWISLGILPLLTYYFSVFQPWSLPLTFLFSFLFDLVLLPGLTVLFILSILKPLTIFNSFFLLIEGVYSLDLKAHVATVGIWSTDGISSDRPSYFF